MVANQSMMRRIGLIVTAALFAVAACGGGGKGDATSTSSSSGPTAAASSGSTTTTTTTLKPEDEVKAAYFAYWAAVDRAIDPNDPALAALAVDPALSFVRDDIASDKAQGITTRMPEDPHHNVHRLDAIQVQGSSASIQDCFIDGRIAIGPNGEVLNNDVVTKRTEATLVRQADGWKVSNVSFIEKSAGVSGCAA